jgi:hypothetical protein
VINTNIKDKTTTRSVGAAVPYHPPNTGVAALTHTLLFMQAERSQAASTYLRQVGPLHCQWQTPQPILGEW